MGRTDSCVEVHRPTVAFSGWSVACTPRGYAWPRGAPIRQTGHVGYVLVLVYLVVLAGALIALLPVQRPPLSGFAFSIGFPAGELAGQLLAACVALMVSIAAVGWPGGATGVVSLACGVAACLAYGWLLLTGLRSRSIVRAALVHARGISVALPDDGSRRWLRGWRTCLAIPLHGRGVRVHRDIAYDPDGLRAHLLDVIAPAHPVSGAPVMIYVHGGAWMFGSKKEQGLPMLYELASRGWVCVTVNYRLSPKATWPDHIVDVKRAIAWTKEHVASYGGSPDRFIAISGGSAGGHLAALAALSPNDPEWQPGFEDADTSVDACVSLYGVLEMTGDPELAGSQGRALVSLLRHSVIKATLDRARVVYESASPIHRITADAPAFLVLHGTKDSLVPVGVARAFVDAFAEASAAPICYVELPGAQHAFDVLCSPRCTATTLGIAAYLEALVGSRAAEPAA